MKKILSNTYGDQLFALSLGVTAYYVCIYFNRDAKMAVIVSEMISFFFYLICHYYLKNFEQTSGALITWATIIALIINVIPIAIIIIIITVVALTLLTTFTKKPSTLNGSTQDKIEVIVGRSVLTAIIPLLTYILAILAVKI